MNKSKREDIEGRLKKVFFEVKGVKPENIQPELSLIDDLGIDSFEAVELIFAIQEEFKIEIPEGAFKNIERIKDIIDYIESCLKTKN